MINVELSNIWSCVSLPDLLSREKEIFDAHLHLRSNASNEEPCFGWLGQPEVITAKMIHAVRSAAETVRAMGGTLVVLGSGSAWLAAQAVIDALLGRTRPADRPSCRVLFAGDNLSSRDWLSLCRQLEGRDYCLHIISPAGQEMETCIASRAIRWMMERRYGAETKQRVFISALAGSPMAVMAAEEGYTLLPMPAQAGGAYSALTSAAFLPVAAAGIDPLAILEGAAEGYRQFDLRAFENPVWMYAGARYALSCRGRNLELFGTFDPSFAALGRWWRRFCCRHACSDGVGAIPMPADWTGDLDAMDAMLHSGRFPLFETMLRFSSVCGQKVNIEMDWKDYDGLEYLAEKSLADVELRTYEALTGAHADGDVPIIALECEMLDEYHMGELLYFLELSAAIYACACGIEPFDPVPQPTRELAARLLGKPENM